MDRPASPVGLVVAVDPGVRALGWFVINKTLKEITFGSVPIVPKDARYKKDRALSWANMRKGFAVFLERMAPVFEAADVLLVENQFNKQHAGSLCCAQVSWFCWRYPEKTVLLSPATVAKHYGLVGMGREAKKKWTVSRFKDTFPKMDTSGCVRVHDAADAWLLYDYWCSNHMINGTL